MLTALPIQKGTRVEGEAKSLYYAAFPPVERMPFGKLLRKAKRAGVHFLGFYDEEVFVGFAYFFQSHDFMYVMYLAVDAKTQSKGYGSRVLEYLESLNPGVRIALEIEALDEQADNYEQRVKRKAFYEKNGFVSAGIELVESGVVYEVLIRNGSCTAEELLSAQKSASGVLTYHFSAPKIHKIEAK